jgi:hypothetical protein
VAKRSDSLDNSALNGYAKYCITGTCSRPPISLLTVPSRLDVLTGVANRSNRSGTSCCFRWPYRMGPRRYSAKARSSDNFHNLITFLPYAATPCQFCVSPIGGYHTPDVTHLRSLSLAIASGPNTSITSSQSSIPPASRSSRSHLLSESS